MNGLSVLLTGLLFLAGFLPDVYASDTSHAGALKQRALRAEDPQKRLLEIERDLALVRLRALVTSDADALIPEATGLSLRLSDDGFRATEVRDEIILRGQQHRGFYKAKDLLDYLEKKNKDGKRSIDKLDTWTIEALNKELPKPIEFFAKALDVNFGSLKSAELTKLEEAFNTLVLGNAFKGKTQNDIDQREPNLAWWQAAETVLARLGPEKSKALFRHNPLGLSYALYKGYKSGIDHLGLLQAMAESGLTSRKQAVSAAVRHLEGLKRKGFTEIPLSHDTGKLLAATALPGTLKDRRLEWRGDKSPMLHEGKWISIDDLITQFREAEKDERRPYGLGAIPDLLKLTSPDRPTLTDKEAKTAAELGLRASALRLLQEWVKTSPKAWIPWVFTFSDSDNCKIRSVRETAYQGGKEYSSWIRVDTLIPCLKSKMRNASHGRVIDWMSDDAVQTMMRLSPVDAEELGRRLKTAFAYLKPGERDEMVKAVNVLRTENAWKEKDRHDPKRRQPNPVWWAALDRATRSLSPADLKTLLTDNPLELSGLGKGPPPELDHVQILRSLASLEQGVPGGETGPLRKPALEAAIARLDYLARSGMRQFPMDEYAFAQWQALPADKKREEIPLWWGERGWRGFHEDMKAPKWIRIADLRKVLSGFAAKTDSPMPSALLAQILDFKPPNYFDYAKAIDLDEKAMKVENRVKFTEALNTALTLPDFGKDLPEFLKATATAFSFIDSSAMRRLAESEALNLHPDQRNALMSLALAFESSRGTKSKSLVTPVEFSTVLATLNQYYDHSGPVRDYLREQTADHPMAGRLAGRLALRPEVGRQLAEWFQSDRDRAAKALAGLDQKSMAELVEYLELTRKDKKSLDVTSGLVDAVDEVKTGKNKVYNAELEKNRVADAVVKWAISPSSKAAPVHWAGIAGRVIRGNLRGAVEKEISFRRASLEDTRTKFTSEEWMARLAAAFQRKDFEAATKYALSEAIRFKGAYYLPLKADSAVRAGEHSQQVVLYLGSTLEEAEQMVRLFGADKSNRQTMSRAFHRFGFAKEKEITKDAQWLYVNSEGKLRTFEAAW